MKNLTLFLVMSLGLFVLGTFANSDTPKAMYKRLPLSFKDNGELRCPGSKIRGPRKDLLTKNLLNRFGITVATRFQVIVQIGDRFSIKVVNIVLPFLFISPLR